MSVVAITGSARGIGRATAEAFLRAGHQVAIGDLDGEVAATVAAQLGPGVSPFALDVADPESFAAFLDGAEAALGPVDVLVNNAGVMLLSPVVDEPDAAVRRMLGVNVYGVITGSRLAVERMLPRGRGHIVNVASTLGKAPLPGAATYCATKHAVVGFTEGLAAELAASPLSVSVVLPGLVNTELSTGVKSIPFVKTAEPADVADAIVAAVGRPKLEVFVPPLAGTIVRTMNVLPGGVRRGLSKALKADRVFTDVDAAARTQYLQREGQ